MTFRKEHRELTPDEKDRIARLKDKAQELHDIITEHGASRETSLAVTSLEQAVMWATKNFSA